MSFKLFEIEFDGNKDSFEEGEKKMNKVCERLGEKFINGWVKYGVEKGKRERDNVKEIYGWIKILEDCDLNNLKEELDGN